VPASVAAVCLAVLFLSADAPGWSYAALGGATIMVVAFVAGR
jgi:hypothetical protein